MSLAPSLVAKLEREAARFAEITELIALPEIATDGRKLPALLQERGRLEAVAELKARRDDAQKRRAEADAILASSAAEPELAELAREELEALATIDLELEREIQHALVREPDDVRRKVIVEIRAGV